MEFSDVPHELVSYILSRLPVKSLKRLSCVNKSWYSLIHDPSFILQQYQYHSSYNTKFLVKLRLPDIPTIKNGFSLLSEEGGEFSHLKVIGSPFKGNTYLMVNSPCINGIIFLNGRNNLALWNPATGECRKLPKCPISYRYKVRSYVVALGFGWISETNDYKVVMVRELRQTTKNDVYLPSQAFVYSLSTNCWRQLSGEVSYFDDRTYDEDFLKNHIYINDTCFWARLTNGCDNYVIYSFHMRDEVFGRIPFPINKCCLGLIGLSIVDGCVAVIMRHIKEKKKFIQTWVMVEYGVEQSWIMKYEIGPVSFRIHDIGFGFMKNVEFFFQDSNGQLLLFNSYTQEVKNLGIRGKNGSISIQAVPYVESLVSISKRKDLNSLYSFQEDNIIVDIKNLYF